MEDVTKLYYYHGLDTTLEYYINTHENLNFCYMGFKALYDMSYLK